MVTRTVSQNVGKGTASRTKLVTRTMGQLTQYMIARDKYHNVTKVPVVGIGGPLEPQDFWSELVVDQGGCKGGGE